jgi:hypothetical protein
MFKLNFENMGDINPYGIMDERGELLFDLDAEGNATNYRNAYEFALHKLEPFSGNVMYGPDAGALLESENYFDADGDHKATHEQLEFLGRLAEKAKVKPEDFKFTPEELENIQKLEEEIKTGRAVLVGGVAVVATEKHEVGYSSDDGSWINDNELRRLSDKAQYGAAIIDHNAHVLPGDKIGDGAVLRKNSAVGHNSTVEGSEIGENAVVGPDCNIKDSVIDDEARVRRHAHVVSSVVGRGALIDPHSKVINRTVDNGERVKRSIFGRIASIIGTGRT